MFLISSIVTVAEGGSNDIYDVVSSYARGRTHVDLPENGAIVLIKRAQCMYRP